MKNIKSLLYKIPQSFYRFVLIGGSATILDFIIYMIISNYIDISISKVISTGLASVYSFILNKKWTFSDKRNFSLSILFKYIVTQIINILVNTIINTLVFRATALKILSFVIATSISMMVNYLLQKIFVFKKKL